MRLTFFIVLLALFRVSANVYSQQTKMSLDLTNVTLKDAFREIENHSNFVFFYNAEQVQLDERVTLRIENKNIDDILSMLFQDKPITYKVVDRRIVLYPKTADGFSYNLQQPLTVKGKVTDPSGAPLPGVTIAVKGTSKGTITGADGSYSLTNVPGNATLTFSFVGMKAQDMPVSGKGVLNVMMEEENIGLEEVVAIGYGTVRKSDLTGAVSKVVENEIVASQYNSIDALLQGRASGVQVAGNSGNPGQGNSVRIRGLNTLSGSGEPLYVVDGIIVNSAGEEVQKTVNDGVEYQTPQSGLMGINPKDIENIEVLKDASATAIYGSRGANGVVLITTKSGKQGKAQINVFSTIDFSSISKTIDVMDPITYARFRNELLALTNTPTMYAITGDQVFPITYTTDPVTGNQTATVGTEAYQQKNWQKELYQTAINKETGLTISGKNEKTSYYLSAGYTDQQGIVKKSEMKTGNVRLNLTQQLNNKLKLDTKISANYMDLKFAHSNQRSGSSLTNVLLRYRPLINETTENIDWDNDLSNPYSFINDFDDLSKELRLYGVASLEYEFIKGLKYQFQAGIDHRDKERSRWYGLSMSRGNTYNGDLGISTLKRTSYTINHLLNLNKVFNKIHRINAVAGFTYDASDTKNSNYEVGDFPIKSLREKLPQAAQLIIKPLTYSFQDQAIASWVFRMNYSLYDKYIITTTFRADGSSKFAKGHKWGYFPATALAWNVERESFMKNLTFINVLKIRAGWGSTGNQSIGPYGTLNSYNTNFYASPENGNLIALNLSGITNSALTWETTNQANIGIDLTVWKDRVNVGIDMYERITKDLLQNMPIGMVNGFTTMPVNLGRISNRGLEVNLDFKVVDKDEYSIKVGGNIAFNRNKLEKLGLAPTAVWLNGKESLRSFYYGDDISTGDFKQAVNIFMEGQPIGMFWGYKTKGIYQTDEEAVAGPAFNGTPNVAGDMIFVDQNNDNNINDADKTFVGNPNPDFIYGFNLAASYKNFTLSALFEGSYGNEIANANHSQIGYPSGTATNNLKDSYLYAWREDMPSNLYPRIDWILNRSVFFDRMVEDGSYLRLNNVTLSYDFNFKKQLIKRLNLYVSGKNLFTLTNYSGYDPVVTSFMYSGSIIGVDWLGTPNTRTYLIGASITF